MPNAVLKSFWGFVVEPSVSRAQQGHNCTGDGCWQPVEGTPKAS